MVNMICRILVLIVIVFGFIYSNGQNVPKGKYVYRLVGGKDKLVFKNGRYKKIYTLPAVVHGRRNKIKLHGNWSMTEVNNIPCVLIQYWALGPDTLWMFRPNQLVAFYPGGRDTLKTYVKGKSERRADIDYKWVPK